MKNITLFRLTLIATCLALQTHFALGQGMVAGEGIGGGSAGGSLYNGATSIAMPLISKNIDGVVVALSMAS
jgi:hypothetical protein